jgi:hypothetical protein
MSFPFINLKVFLPSGSIWNIEDGGDFDSFVLGCEDSLNDTMLDLESLADTRNPLKTTLLEDLEKEFGLQANASLSDTERRNRLLGEKTDNNSTATHEWLQDALRKRGFSGIFVYSNDPGLADPSIFGGELIVNGDPISEDPEIYQIPSEESYWGLFFFIGGAATYKPVDLLIDEVGTFLVDESGVFLGSSAGELTSILPIEVDASRREELRTEILKYKPIFSWCVLVASYI